LVENGAMSTPEDPIARFLSSPAYGVVGASSRRHKYGNKVLRCYQQNGRRAIPVNPRERVIEGADCVASVLDLPDDVKSISVITPPAVTERTVQQAISRGIENVWMQPGAESEASIEACRKAGINVIADGSCVLVVLGYRER
jgi:predicted CoA-binding protein